ncbi:MAG: hypothetical protein GYA71_05095 [Bacteroidales bacterium]|nr:hypothetical protein [Bacteroidales bacterium]
MLKDVKAGVITCNGVQAAGRGNFPGMGPGGMPGGQQQQPQPETPFEVSYDYFRIVNTGLN